LGKTFFPPEEEYQPHPPPEWDSFNNYKYGSLSGGGEVKLHIKNKEGTKLLRYQVDKRRDHK
jgi:hypothetical protein